ncbi:MAG: Inner-membrane translocator [Candidatus Nomurabacteria bacterium GW2011_GWC2_41_8]|uniref:Branched-chain amino acid ABC transporter permease n=3 Tax=Candidatus Nomuraibacteriota TaxID=1752729 RepID=A0A1F6YDE1_9BACT|nr:MAG: Inner-membrane translocator [Candidatus Nomurabacteria bacterium GW2011_GWA2_41_25]KKS24203.1 MAG: Inner-membrane translocator [Candidatus Nomurabacteria bacterium GW2011_GWC2_41_8]OGI67215.1 MAG: hypothetical protein A2823_02180 [Candidatus Nomurabacteria bacterium RIFCSPHIGHO2_01_FULL_41_91]OGI80571.1 MAG: hypothetical protein A3D43_01985 [Candidatus Nomurabacteria bacterium RIFCSPHIGHO2_02_FULL_41_52]OGI84456.1 MAG: hypothetical protein A3F49_03375 [Candidatus Nomurabacteria bacteriu
MEFFQLILYTISTGMLYSLLATGFGFTLRSVKFFNISYGGAFLVGGYVMFLFYRMQNIAFLPSLLLSLTASGLYLLLAYKFIFKILIERKAKNLVLLIVSFGLLTATSAILGMIFGSQATIVTRHLSDIDVVNIFGATLNTVQIVGGLISIPIIILSLAYVRYKTRFGRAVRAIEDDSEVAELVGIPKNKILLKTFFLSGMLAGMGGILEGLDVGIIPASGFLYMLPTIVAVVIGGMQSFWGGILGAFILAIAQQLTIVVFGGSWVQAVPFVILIIMLWIRPEGILKR